MVLNEEKLMDLVAESLDDRVEDIYTEMNSSTGRYDVVVEHREERYTISIKKGY